MFEIGLSIVGQRRYNQERIDHRLAPVTFANYLVSADFMEATMENWESEFLQMFADVVLTTFLFQKGSAESKSLDGNEAVDRDPREARLKQDAPSPVRRGGLSLTLYSHSLSLALLLLFCISFALHAMSGAREHSILEVAHGGHAAALPRRRRALPMRRSRLPFLRRPLRRWSRARTARARHSSIAHA